MITLLISTTAFFAGVVCGMLLDYATDGRYLRKRIEELTHHILTMRKQGFVPQFTFEQRRSSDPAQDISEF